MKQGEFISSKDTLTILSNANETGVHTLYVYIPGTGVLTATFDAVSATPFDLPNIFPELGTYRFRIKEPSGSWFDDLSGCSMWLELIPHCGEHIVEAAP